MATKNDNTPSHVSMCTIDSLMAVDLATAAYIAAPPPATLTAPTNTARTSIRRSECHAGHGTRHASAPGPTQCSGLTTESGRQCQAPASPIPRPVGRPSHPPSDPAHATTRHQHHRPTAKSHRARRPHPLGLRPEPAAEPPDAGWQHVSSASRTPGSSVARGERDGDMETMIEPASMASDGRSAHSPQHLGPVAACSPLRPRPKE